MTKQPKEIQKLSEEAQEQCLEVFNMFYEYVDKKIKRIAKEQKNTINVESIDYKVKELYKKELVELRLHIKQQSDRIQHINDPYGLRLDETMLYKKVYLMMNSK
jgi:hypothetical protein